MGKLRLICLAVLMIAVAGCKPGAPKELTKTERAQVGMLAGEADFATQLRDHSRAEDCWRKVVEIDRSSSNYWMQLGFSCRRQDKNGDAKAAYKKALSLRETDFRRNKTAENLLAQIEVQALLGRESDARKVLEKAQREFPDDRAVRAWVEQKMIDRMLADPGFKALAL